MMIASADAIKNRGGNEAAASDEKIGVDFLLDKLKARLAKTCQDRDNTPLLNPMPSVESLGLNE